MSDQSAIELNASRHPPRRLLQIAGAGFGYLALAGMLGQKRAREVHALRTARPLAPKPPHFPVKAKRIIFLFMEGAMSPDGHLGIQAAASEGRRQGRPRRRHA